MEKKPFSPYVPASADLPELTIKAVLLGVIMAVVLGAANAYLGMKVGLTVAATFPAAVVAMAALRIFKGSILEENIARTTASVGEALVAGAIFTIPAFVISGAWEELRYFESTAIMLIGGLLGVFFIIILRRTLVVEADLPYPESVAAAEIVKAGQGGQTGASFVFGAMGFAGLWELLKNSKGIQVVADSASGFLSFGSSTIEILQKKVEYTGGILLATAAASPALMGVGFIVGPRVSSVLFAGAVFGWLLLVPLALFLNPAFAPELGVGATPWRFLTEAQGAEGAMGLAMEVWSKQIRPLAVGTMIVAAFYTLYNLRTSLTAGISKALSKVGTQGAAAPDRTDTDMDFKKVAVAIGLLSVATLILYYYFAQSLVGAIILTVAMVILGFLFSAVAGYLVGLIGSSNNPISGLTLSALLISAVLMVFIGVTDVKGVAAVLGVAGVVCCAAGIAGDMMQDLKVGHILGGTPWRMQVGEIFGVIAAALVLSFPLMALHSVYGIGSPELPAPQAGLMALMANGIVGGQMAWPLVIVGMFLALGMILIGAPSPMLIAVGMYLPFESTSAMFVGGLLKWALDLFLARREASPTERTRAENTGTLLSSGLIAGESLMAVLIAFYVLAGERYSTLSAWRESLTSGITPQFWLGLFIYPVIFYLLVWLPLQKMKSEDLSSAKTP
jgi:putative OPT family oligopeptide transporter